MIFYSTEHFVGQNLCRIYVELEREEKHNLGQGKRPNEFDVLILELIADSVCLAYLNNFQKTKTLKCLKERIKVQSEYFQFFSSFRSMHFLFSFLSVGKSFQKPIFVQAIGISVSQNQRWKTMKTLFFLNEKFALVLLAFRLFNFGSESSRRKTDFSLKVVIHSFRWIEVYLTKQLKTSGFRLKEEILLRFKTTQSFFPTKDFSFIAHEYFTNKSTQGRKTFPRYCYWFSTFMNPFKILLIFILEAVLPLLFFFETVEMSKMNNALKIRIILSSAISCVALHLRFSRIIRNC